MNGESLNIRKMQLEKLRELFPEAVTEGKIDWEKLQATLGKENIEFRNERYVLNWAGKTDAFKVLQQTTTATLKPVPEESINFNTTENVFIEGENLEVLKVLQKAYYGKVKVICIDPPYNTGNDSFIYPDSFKESKEDYQKRIGEKDEEGYLLKEGYFRKNSKDSGHYHSNWLSMMYPRLFLAKNLLRDDGVIFVHIDDNEVHNLRLIMNEIFGEENFRNIFAVRRYDKNLNRQFIESGLQTFNVGFEYVLCYSIGSEFTFNPILKLSDEERQNFGYWKGFWNDADRRTMRFDILGFNPETGQWKWSKERSLKAVENYKIFQKDFSEKMTLEKYWESTGKVLEFIRRNPEGNGRNKGVENWIAPSRGKLRNTNWTDLFASKNSNEVVGLFDFPKNPEVIKNFLIGSTDQNDIILDFFAGSATTAQAVLELNKEDGGNRKFILVQLPEKCDEESEAYKAGYKTIADIGKERIRRVITKLTSPPAPLLVERGVKNDYYSNLFKDASPTIFENAHRLRLVDKTEAEQKLWQQLRNRKIENCKFRRQHPLGNFIADFYCHEKELVVEVDGGYHSEKEQREHDALRTEAIKEFGILVIRFTNEEVLNNIESVTEKISKKLTSTPSPQGEGKGEVGFKVFKLSPSNFKIWRGDEITEENLESQLDAFTNPVREGSEKENMLYELMLKAGYLLTDRVEYKNKLYYVNGSELIIALEEMNQILIDTIISTKPKKVITLDKLFAGNDQLKTNAVLQMRDAEIDFKTI